MLVAADVKMGNDALELLAKLIAERDMAEMEEQEPWDEEDDEIDSILVESEQDEIRLWLAGFCTRNNDIANSMYSIFGNPEKKKLLSTLRDAASAIGEAKSHLIRAERVFDEESEEIQTINGIITNLTLICDACEMLIAS